MALLDPAFPPPGQVVEHGAKVLLDFPEDRFLTVLRYENHKSGSAASPPSTTRLFGPDEEDGMIVSCQLIEMGRPGRPGGTAGAHMGARAFRFARFQRSIAGVIGVGLLDVLQDLTEIVACRFLQRRELLVGLEFLQP
jgi:hypothetical protein